MNRFLSYTFLLGALVGCRAGELPPSETASETVAVSLPVVPEESESITRLTDEDRIADINLYLFGTDNGFRLHLYKVDASQLYFECPAGNYTIYALANMHEDLGDLSSSQLAACTFAHADRLADLPMTACIQVPIRPAAGGIVSLPALEVRRRVAKIAYRITVDPCVSDIVLQSVQAFNLPRRTPLFGEVHPSATASDYTAGVRMNITSMSFFSGRHYQLANPQGIVAGIASQQDKNAVHAPEYASYLLIRALHGQKVLAYRVYLGENNTNNFDVRCNTSHRLDITILGGDEIDTRVSSYTVRAGDDIEAEKIGDYCVQDSQRSLWVRVEGTRNDLPLHAEITVNRGDGSNLLLNGEVVNESLEFDLSRPEGTSSYELNYSPEIFDRTNEVLSYTVTVRDEGGASQSFSFRHNYANILYTLIHDGTDGTDTRGIIDVQDALYDQVIGGTRNSRLILTDEDGCSLTAIPNPGYRFAGWYADRTHTKLLSAASRFDYKPQRTSDSMFARFLPDGSSQRVTAMATGAEFLEQK